MLLRRKEDIYTQKIDLFFTRRATFIDPHGTIRMTTLTTTTASTRIGIPYEVAERLRSYIREYRCLRQNELASMKRHQNMSQRVQSSYNRWNRLQTMKNVRKMFLYLNKVKYSVFTYTEMKLWRTISDRKRALTAELQKILQHKTFTGDNEKYTNTCIATIGKYNDNYGLFIACAMNRVFCYDVARLILMYI